MFCHSPLGKNKVSDVPREMAQILKLKDPQSYTFHSLRRSSATCAADSGASVQQLMDFYGWKNTNMPQEYISSSKVAVKGMAERLQCAGQKNEAPSVLKNQREKVPSSVSGGDGTMIQSTSNSDQIRGLSYEKAEKIVIIENFSGNFHM